MASKEKIEESIVLPKLNIQEMRITLIGDSPLICHAWSDKARKQILDKQQKKARQARAAKDPQRDFEESLYRHPEGGYGFPAVAFKAAAVDACSHVEGITKVQARGAFHIVGELARLDGEPRMRAEFPAWSTTLDIRYNGNVLSMEQIANLFNTAGFAVGVGEWRPQKDGSFGMFHAEA